MKEDKFIKENSAAWKNLEATLGRLKSKGFQRFEKNELDSFINLYNRTCGHLSYCRTYYGSTATTDYLNRLVAAAHSYIYTTKTSNLKKLVRFFLKEFPILLRENMNYFLISMAIFVLGIAVSFVYTLISSDNASSFLPSEIINNVNFNGNGSSWDSTLMSSFIFTNNIKVGISAFVMGITLGIGTGYALMYNGFMLGGLGALAHHGSADLKFWSLILPHGVLELFSIFVCGAAGLIIAYSIIHPGIYSRKDSFIMKGKVGMKLVCGTIPIFVIAGLIEGFITPMGFPELGKLTVAAFTLVLLVLYLVLPNFSLKKHLNLHH